MWPLISPASGAPVSLSLALTSAWPVFHISGLPPWRSTRPASGAFDVVDDLPRRDCGSARRRRTASAGGREDDLAVLGHHAQAVAVAVEGQADLGVRFRRARCTSARFSGLDGSGWWLGKLPSTSQNRASPVRSPGAGTVPVPRAGDAVAAVDDDLHRAAQHHLQAVVLGRIVAARHRYATRGAQFVRGEIGSSVSARGRCRSRRRRCG
jgi:hypothetical protein